VLHGLAAICHEAGNGGYIGSHCPKQLRASSLLGVDSLDELKTRLEQYFEEINQTPVIFRWKYGLESIEVA